jgi:predicted permease
MNWLRITASRLRALFRKRRLDGDLDAELRSHLEFLTEEKIHLGMNPEEARRSARREFGGVEQTKQKYRDQRGLPFLETLFQDMRYAARTLFQRPGFAVTAILTLAIGIGVNTAIFSVVSAVLLKPLPFPDPQRIVAVHQTLPRHGVFTNGVSYLNLNDWRDQTTSFERLGAFHADDLTLTGLGAPEVIDSAMVTPDLLPLLGVRPVAGRLILPEEDQPGAAPVVVMSERLWRRLGSSSTMVGSSITLNKRSFTVVGIVPESFQFPFQMPPVNLWIPVNQDQNFKDFLPRRGGHYLSAIARLKPGRSLEQAQSELAGIEERLAKLYPEDNAGWGVRIAPLQMELVGDVRLPLLVLLGAVALVLLIACANVANLLLARATSRAREMAVRTALGAGKLRLVRQVLTESVLLSAISAALGLAAAWWGVRALASLLPAELPRLHDIHVDASALYFTLAVALFVGVLFGLAPALQAAETDMHESLKEGSRSASEGSRRQRMRGILVISEVALAMVLLTGAGLLIRSFYHLQSVSPGFRAEGLLVATTALPQSQYTTPEEWSRFYGQALDRIKSLPGVEGVAVALPLPMAGSRIDLAFQIEGRPLAPGEGIDANYAAISHDFLRVLGIPLLRGRDFDAHDTATSPKVSMVNETFAHHYFPGEDPIGKRIVFGFNSQAPREIVGIVADTKQEGLDLPVEPEMYLPYEQDPCWVMNFGVRGSGNPAALAAAVRERIQSADKDLPVVDPQPMTDYLHSSVAQPRFRTFLLGLFAVTALLLAAVGIYGVISYSVSQRTREIGLRIALGAQPGELLRLIVGQSMALVSIGLAAGLLGSFALAHFLKSLLFVVTPRDPLTYAIVVLTLLCVSLLACGLPVRRAMRVDPMVALRYE